MGQNSEGMSQLFSELGSQPEIEREQRPLGHQGGVSLWLFPLQISSPRTILVTTDWELLEAGSESYSLLSPHSRYSIVAGNPMIKLPLKVFVGKVARPQGSATTIGLKSDANKLGIARPAGRLRHPGVEGPWTGPVCCPGRASKGYLGRSHSDARWRAA